eukprot:1724474-Rhodomonas_salina.6
MLDRAPTATSSTSMHENAFLTESWDWAQWAQPRLIPTRCTSDSDTLHIGPSETLRIRRRQHQGSRT